MHLRPLSRLFWVAINLGAGLFPSLAFFVWIERNASLPLISGERLLPALLPSSYLASQFPDFSDPLLNTLSFFWDTALILLFGLIHSLAAQPGFLKRVDVIIPPQAQRTVYLAITGIAATAVMGLWQSTGQVLWNFPVSPILLQSLQMLLFWAFLAAGSTVIRNPWTFLGLKPIYSTIEQIRKEEANPELLVDGLYKYLRHPIYAFTLCALWLTPVMTLDRAAIAIGISLYLIWGIPMEERKLAARFGDRYRDFQKQVPALIPKI